MMTVYPRHSSISEALDLQGEHNTAPVVLESLGLPADMDLSDPDSLVFTNPEMSRMMGSTGRRGRLHCIHRADCETALKAQSGR